MRSQFGLRAFARRNDGSVAMMFGLSMMGLMLAAGLSLDYARAFSVQTGLQADLDSALLGAASEMAQPAQIQSKAQKYFNANWSSKHNVGSVTLTVTKVDNTHLRGVARAKVPTTLMKMAGFNEVDVEAVAEVEVAGNDIEMALVLDTTASMAGAKMDALKTNATMLIDEAFAAPNASQHVKISVVPFGQYVNIGMSNRNATWMNVPLDAQVPRQSCYDHENITSTSNCRMETTSGTNDGVPVTSQAEVCDHTYGPPVYSCDNWTEDQAWYGCTGSRNNPLDVSDTNWSTKAPGIMGIGCGSELLPLTNDASALTSKINSLTTSGDTYIPGGLFWGWTTLSKTAPFTQARDYGEIVDGKAVRKIMVLMTDGFNTLSPVYPHHTGYDATLSNNLTSDLCNNIKGKDVELFTVAFQVKDVSVKDILETCATSQSHYFDADSPDALKQSFKAIAGSFTPLRLAN